MIAVSKGPQTGAGLVTQKFTPNQEGSGDPRGELFHFVSGKVKFPIYNDPLLYNLVFTTRTLTSKKIR